MYFETGFDVSFFELLRQIDRVIAEAVRVAGCPWCGCRLDRADYPRKPRGGAYAPDGEGETVRFSFCCDTEGCRKRVTPPSVRFLGRKVYLSVVVVMAAVHVVQQAEAEAAALRGAPGVPVRTQRRWVTWWQSVFVVGLFYAMDKGGIVPPVADAEVPGGILARFKGATVAERMELFLRWLSPVTTGSCPDGARLSRAV